MQFHFISFIHSFPDVHGGVILGFHCNHSCANSTSLAVIYQWGGTAAGEAVTGDTYDTRSGKQATSVRVIDVAQRHAYCAELFDVCSSCRWVGVY